MKETRSAFLFIGGNPNDVELALGVIKDFKGISLINSNEVSAPKVLEVFGNNKSIVTSDSTITSYVTKVFEISVNNSTQVLNIDTSGDIQKQFKAIANLCNIDIGDHRSNATKNGGAQTPAECSFCKYAHGLTNSVHETIYESESFIVFATIGQFIPGYLLIVPRKHVMSTAELSTSEFDEMLEVIEDITFILKQVYKKDVIIFENGSGRGGHGKDKSSIVHAHVHIATFEMELLKTSTEKGIPLSGIQYEDLPNYAESSYLLVRNYDEKWYINYNHELYIPRQYVRQLIAEAANIPGELWNWREYPFEEATLQTYLDIQKYMKSHMELWSERILERTTLLKV